jgi:hypothetical protein
VSVFKSFKHSEVPRFWEDEEGDHLEDARKMEASSIGVAAAGLIGVRDYFLTMPSAQMPLGATKPFVDQTCRRAESLIEPGQAALKAC